MKILHFFFSGTRPKQATANLYPPIFVQPNLGSKGRIWFWFKVGSKSGGIKESESNLSGLEESESNLSGLKESESNLSGLKESQSNLTFLWKIKSNLRYGKSRIWNMSNMERNQINPIPNMEYAWLFPLPFIFVICYGIKEKHASNKAD